MKYKQGNGKRKRVTIHDVAKISKVSISTVSRVLNNSAPVDRSTKEKVLQAIQEVNYTPNAMARGLVNKTSKTIGILVPDILNPFYMELIKAVEDITSKYGFSLFLCITNQNISKEEKYINEMIERRTNGLMIISTTGVSQDIINKAKEYMEIVSIQADIEGVDRIDVTSEQGTFEIIEYLIGLGHKKIAFIGYLFNLRDLARRLTGYKKALKKHGIPIREEYIIEGSVLGNPGYTMAKQLLELDKRPTAIHCINEYVVMGAYMAIAERNLSIPKDISLTGFDNLVISRLLTPRLTTVSQPVHTMGEMGAELLIRNILEENLAAKHKRSIVLPTELIIRGSTGPPNT